MSEAGVPAGGNGRIKSAVALTLLFFCVAGVAADWPQYGGPTADSVCRELIFTHWPANGPPVVWRNSSVSNGFSCLAISQGRAFTLMSKDVGGTFYVYCVALNAANGTNLWATQIDTAPWDPTYQYNGGDGSSPWNMGDGPRSTPSVVGGKVLVLIGQLVESTMHLLCLNATNGAVIWDNDLAANYGATTIQYDSCASPLVDNDLVFLNLNTSTNDQTLLALNVNDGSQVWNSQNETVTHTTPIIATLQGVRQVIFSTQTALVSVNRDTGDLLWRWDYAWGPIGSSMGASPCVYSNLIYCTTAYGKGAAAIRVTQTNGTWNVSQLYWKDATAGQSYQSIYATPVCYQGYIYTMCGGNTTFLTTPLNCIELATGNLMWSTNNFGLGGLIMVNSNILALTEKGALVLVRCNPSAYTELARFQAFTFTTSAHGKCWNHPTFSDGHIYAHSTREAIGVDVSMPALTLAGPKMLNKTQAQVTVSTINGSAISSNRFSFIEIHATNNLSAPRALWPKITNQLTLATNGVARFTNNITGQTSRYFMTVEPP